MRRWWLVVGLVPPLAACPRPEASPILAVPMPPRSEAPLAVVGTPEAEGPSATDDRSRAPGAPLAAPPPGRRSYLSDWRDVPAGHAPPELIDIRADGHTRTWLYDGGWRIAHREGGAVLEVPFALRSPSEPLSFRRWTGTTFGPDGALPRRFRVEAEGRSLGGSTRFNGYGELAIQAFYLDPENYVEVLHTDRALLLWQAKDAPPMQGRGWRQLGRHEHPAKTGDWLRFGAEIDRDSGEVLAWLDGRVVLRARASLIAADAPARLTIRATGNKEEWRRLSIVELR